MYSLNFNETSGPSCTLSNEADQILYVPPLRGRTAPLLRGTGELGRQRYERFSPNEE